MSFRYQASAWERAENPGNEGKPKYVNEYESGQNLYQFVKYFLTL